MCSQYQAVEIATLLPGSHIKEIIDSDRIVYVGAMTEEKNRLPCIQTRCYWFVDLEKRGNITKLNCFRCQFKVPLSSHRSLIFQGVHILFQMPFIQCNNSSVLPRPFSEGGTPCRFLVTPCPFQEAEMTPCPFLGDAQRRPVTFYLTPNVTVHGNRRGNYAARTFPLFYSTAFVIVIRLVYKNLRYWPIRIYFGRLAIDCCINFIQ